MSTKKKLSKIFKWLSTGILTSGVVLAIGLLGYFGMLALIPSIALAWGAFVLAGLVDGEVFFQNISHGINNSKLLFKQRSIKFFLIHELEHTLSLTKDKPPEERSPFEKDYYDLKEYLLQFDHKKLDKEQKEKVHGANKRLRRMQKMYLQQVLHPETATAETIKNYFKDKSGKATIVEEAKMELPGYQRKRTYLRLSVPISIAAGIGFGFATAAALEAAMGAAAAGLMAVVWPLALIAAAGYGFLIFRTFSQMITSDSFKAWKERINSWFRHDNKPKDLSYWLKSFIIGLGVVASITLGILATLATAGTWWLAVQNGAKLAKPLASTANIIRNIFVPIAAAANLFFTTRNTLTSVNQLIGKYKHSDKHSEEKKKSPKDYFRDLLQKAAEYTPKKIRERNPDKSAWEIYNPFRILAAIISAPYLTIIFIGHIIAMGLTGDRTPGLSYNAMIASAFFGALSDFFVDFHYFSPETAEEKDASHRHEHEEHEHSHGFFPKLILNIALSPLLICATIWDFFASKSWKAPSPAQKFKTFALLNFGFEIHETIAKENEPKLALSKQNQQAVILSRLEKHDHRLQEASMQPKVIAEKRAALHSLKEEFNSAKAPEAVKVETAINILKKPRSPSFFASKTPKSASMATQIRDEVRKTAAA